MIVVAWLDSTYRGDASPLVYIEHSLPFTVYLSLTSGHTTKAALETCCTYRTCWQYVSLNPRRTDVRSSDFRHAQNVKSEKTGYCNEMFATSPRKFVLMSETAMIPTQRYQLTLVLRNSLHRTFISSHYGKVRHQISNNERPDDKLQHILNGSKGRRTQTN